MRDTDVGCCERVAKQIVSVEPLSRQQQTVREERQKKLKKSGSSLKNVTLARDSSFRRSPKPVAEDDDEDKDLTFTVQPSEEGLNSGRPAIIQAPSVELMHEWVDALDTQVQQAIDRVNAEQTALDRWRTRTRDFYHSDRTQYAIGLVILGSYLMAIGNAQMLPDMDAKAEADFYFMEVVFTVIFALELAVNLFGSWFRPFISDGWNVFDSIVVVISIIGLVVQTLPAVNVLRLIRVFKVCQLNSL